MTEGPIALDHVQVAIPPGGEAHAKSFYEGLLGLGEIPKPPNLAARGGAWFRNEFVRIDAGVEDPFSPARKAHPALRFVSLDALAGRLMASGHDVRWDTEIPGIRRFYTDDPFGNRIECLE